MLVAIVAANLQHLSGKPWAMTALIHPIESAKPVLIEPRGTRRLSSQTLLDVRVSRAFRFRDAGRVEVSLDVLNILNDTAEESIKSAVYDAANVGQPDIFVDPRRAMLSVRLNLGRTARGPVTACPTRSGSSDLPKGHCQRFRTPALNAIYS
jgi:hypothetical protein